MDGNSVKIKIKCSDLLKTCALLALNNFNIFVLSSYYIRPVLNYILHFFTDITIQKSKELENNTM